jgi:hypothetical protein
MSKIFSNPFPVDLEEASWVSLNFISPSSLLDGILSHLVLDHNYLITFFDANKFGVKVLILTTSGALLTR